MATISFEREIRLKPEDMWHFLDVLERQEKRGDNRHYIDIAAEPKVGERLLDEYFSRHSSAKAKTSARGIAKKYANPKLIPLEEKAFEKAMMEKHENLDRR